MSTSATSASHTQDVGTLARGTAVNMVGSGFNIVSRLVFNVALARMLGASLLGLYYLTLTIGSVLGVVAVGGFNAMLIRYLAHYREEKNWGAFRGTLRFAIWAVAAIGLAGSGVMFFGAHLLAGPIFHKPVLATPLRIFALYVPFFAIEQLVLAATQSFKEMKYKMYVESVLNPGLRLAFLFFIYLAGGGLYAVLISYVFSVLVCAVVSFPALKQCLKMNLSKFEPMTRRRELLDYTYPLFGVNVLTFVILYADSFVLGHFRLASELGLYSVCLRLMTVTAFALPVVNQIFAPMIAELHHRGEIAQLGANFKVVTLWAVEFYLPLVILFVAAPREVLALFGSEFRAAAPCLVILAVGQLANVITGPVGQMICMVGWTRLQLWITAVFLFVQMVLAVALVPGWGYLGAAVANSVAIVGANAFQVWFVHRRLRIHPFSWTLGKPLIAAGVAMLAALPVWRSIVPMSPYRWALLCGAMLFAYVGMLVALGMDHYSRLAWNQLRDSLQRRFGGGMIGFAFGKGVR